jgi:hypothetical protein
MYDIIEWHDCMSDVWTDTDAKFGIPSPPPFLSLSMADDDDFLTGVNFASGGAGILNETGVYFVSCMVTYFLAALITRG